MRVFQGAPVTVLIAVLALAGCGKGESGKVESGKGEKSVSAENASVESVTNQAKDTLKLQPGQWEMKFEIGKMDMPGMPAGAPQTKQAAQTSSTCITPEQAAKPAGDILAGKGAGDCKFDKFNMAGGKLDAVMSCKLPNMPGQSKTTMSGTYSSTAFSNEISSSVSGMPGGQTMSIQAKSSGRRTGECAAKAN